MICTEKLAVATPLENDGIGIYVHRLCVDPS